MESDFAVIHPSEITKENVEAALKTDKGSEAHLVSFTVQECTKKGDNFATSVARVNVNFSTEKGDDYVSYVVKYDPRRYKPLQDFLCICFQKELSFYKHFVHEIQSQLQEVGQTPLRVPQCFHSSLEENREVLFLEDLRPRGFKIFDRKRGLDVAQTKLILEELARLHAASYLLNTKDTDLPEKYPILNMDWLNYADNARRNTHDMYSSIMDSASKLLHLIGGYEVAVAWLAENKEIAAEMIGRALRREPPFAVLCHGDCWNNNVLVRYNDEEVPEEVMLIDLQVVRHASLATDLNYLFHTSVQGQILKDNLTSLLSHYHTCFGQVLKAGGCTPPFSLPDLMQEYRNHLPYGLLMCLLAVVFGLSEGVELSDSERRGTKEEQLLCAMKKKPKVRDIFLSTINELMDNGIIT
ncbi:uncharacterized protein LOC122266864 [Penaeus japonicus]|uniref:uncharacterized protein LOC122266864 n=1 Tax=Penaeus japonicus TaxID=27405 RepID=UPI001C70EF41|nr:uncharacterized protein LOC122266864 [Penaeus japonicus]XP_042892721.1 uncharacterized protein LOC122266864 [Penaeus japonicus]